jgi:hypothetical protein
MVPITAGVGCYRSTVRAAVWAGGGHWPADVPSQLGLDQPHNRMVEVLRSNRLRFKGAVVHSFDDSVEVRCRHRRMILPS